MRYRDCMIAWNPNGGVAVGPCDSSGWDRPYRMTGGGSYTITKKWSAIRCAAQVMCDYNTLTVGHGIDPAEAHREFLKIDEYRFPIPCGLPGAEDTPDWFTAEWGKGTTKAEWLEGCNI